MTGNIHLSYISHSNSYTIANFFCTCSRSELEWLIAESTAHLLGKLSQNPAAASKPGRNEYDHSHSPANIPIDAGRRCIRFPGTTAFSAVEAVASFLAGLVILATANDSSSISKTSQMRSKITAMVALRRIHDHLLSALPATSKDNVRLLWAVRNAQCRILRNELGSTRSDIAIDEIDAQPQHHPPPHFLPLHIDHKLGSTAPRPPPVTVTRPAKVPKEIPQRVSSTLVVPSAGRSSRFPGHKPKWLLTQPNGRLMLVDAIAALDLSTVRRIVVGLLKEHLDKHCGSDVHTILRAFEDGPPLLDGIEVSIVVISVETVDQVQTIEEILRAASVTGPIFLKDCDNQFACDVRGIDGVATLQITREMQSLSIPASKSYAVIDGTGHIDNIVEKVILGSTFCVGGYAFAEADDMVAHIGIAREYQRITGATTIELAVSDVIWLKMIFPASDPEQPPFQSIPVTGYEDWGTLQAWQAYVRTFKTLFLDIDGTVIKNSGGYFKPVWGMQPPLARNVAYLKELHARGRTQIILTTSRPDSFREITVNQLAEAGVPYDNIVFGMFHAQRVLVNDYAKTNPFPSAVAVNVRRDADDFPDMLAHLQY